MIKCITFYKPWSFKKNVFKKKKIRIMDWKIMKNSTSFYKKMPKKNLPERKEYVICNEDVQSPYHCFTII